MHPRNPIVNIPLLIGIVLSIALHVAAFYGRGIYTPPKPLLKQGRTVVQLTLLPSLASKESSKPESLNPKPAPPPSLLPDRAIPVPQAARLPDPTPPESPATKPESISSPDQNASLIKEKGVITEASLSSPFRPAYPRISQHRREEGTVLLSIEVLASGKAGNIKIIKSSGHRHLDAAAVKAAKKTIYNPAMQLGRPIDSIFIQPLAFTLTRNE